MDEMYDRMRRMNEANKTPNDDKELLDILQKRFKTTFIGAISAIEEEFGFLWGRDKPFAELTDNEKRFLKLWKETRNRILNNGNEQSRGVVNDLKQFKVTKQRVFSKLKPRREM